LAAEFNKRNLAVIEEVFSPNFVLHDANHPHWPRGLEGARKMFTVMLTAAPNLQITVEDTVAEGDKVVVRWTFRGTSARVSVPAAASSEEPITELGIGVYRLVEGKIEEDWGIAARCLTKRPWE
jgi:predicted ester cyclase